MSDVARLAVAVNEAQFALGNETFDACGARFVRNVRFPRVRDANHVSHVTASSAEEVAALMARMDVEHAASPARSIHCDPDAPPGVEAALLLAGHRCTTVILSVLEGPLAGGARPHDVQGAAETRGSRVKGAEKAFQAAPRPDPRPTPTIRRTLHDVREASSEADWLALRDLARMDWRETCERTGECADEAVGDDLFEVHRLECPPARTFLVRAAGITCGHVTALPGLDGMGQVESLFVAPAFRRRGMARALIARAVDACREGRAAAVLIAADAADTPKTAYAAMGFRPVAVKRDYWRNVAS